jgi:hypothetical protein
MKSTPKTKAWDAFSLYIRTRDCLLTTGCPDWGLCITCGKRYHIKLLQAGHFIPGRHLSNLFSEKGTHAQCYNCNINLKGNTLEYRRKIVEMYGVGADEELEKISKTTRQIKDYEYESMIALFKDMTIEAIKKGASK